MNAPSSRSTRPLVQRLAALPLLLGASALACSSASPSGTDSTESTGTSSAAVIKGKNSDKTQDAVVLLIHYEPKTGEVGACTGTLLSPRLVLTARHCVANTDEAAACDATGTPLAEGAIQGNHPADSLYVFTGPTRPEFGRSGLSPAGQGMKILDDGGKNLCNHDIALVVLKEPIANAQIAPIRLESDIAKGEIVTAVGWGVTDQTPQPDVRQQRTGIAVLGVGPSENDRLPVPPNEFEVGESICSGDSGGPALADTGAIVGIVSRGGNATRPDPQDPASSCIGGTNLYTKITPFKELILSAYELVEAEPWYENGADPRLLKPGSTCTDGAECRSNLCLADPDQGSATTCAADCSATACPEGQECKVEGEAQVCRNPAPKKAATTTTTGCATSPGSSSSNGVLGFALAALGLVALRRRRA